MKARELGVFLGIIFVLMFTSMYYLYIRGNLAGQSGLEQVSQVLTGGAILFLFFMVTAAIGILASSLGWFGKKSPDVFSGRNDIQLGGTFMLFFLPYYFLLLITKPLGAQSILTFPTQSIFSQVSSIITEKFWNIVVIGVSAPLAEELFFIAFLAPISFYIIYRVLTGMKLPRPASLLLSSILMFAFVDVIFANFHVAENGNQIFLLSALFFRTLTLLLIYSDALLNVVPFLVLGIGASMGLHFAVNLATVTTPPEFLYTLLITADGTIIGHIIGLLVIGFLVINFAYMLKLVKLDRLVRRSVA